MLAILFVLIAVAVRFLPHPLAFTPVGAALLYFGARAPRKYLWFPLVLLAASDVYLTRATYGYPFTLDHLATWAWYGAALWLGARFLGRDARPLRVVGAAIAASVSFFLLSNFAVWLVWNMYPKTLGGLAACYVAGLPFFRNDLASVLFFSGVMFGVGALVARHGAAETEHTAAV